MLLTCPACGCQASSELWQNDNDARDVFALYASLPAEVQGETLRYLALFRPGKSKLSWSRAKRLMTELRDLVIAGDVVHDRKPRCLCTPSVWAAAMAQMVERRDKITRPLPNHNYLVVVAYDMAQAAQEGSVQSPAQNDHHRVGPSSKTMSAVAKLQEFARGQ
ncbi:MAG: hypothetical protein HQM01_14310 [Magnetococcales bacterium]|nr:hypothetical protein [Magnetococcales bacterium]